MRHALSNAQLIEEQLRGGATAQELIKLGFPNTSVYRVKNRLERGDGQRESKSRSRRIQRVDSSDDTGVRVRLTQEEIFLPASMFMLYDLVKARHPRYEATKSEWLMDVVQTWAIDHAHELGFQFMFPGIIGEEREY